MTESQKTISDWADETFGRASSITSIATRANKEMAELLHKIAIGEDNKLLDSHDVCMEVADIMIVLARIPEYLGHDINKLINEKMKINRKRKWKLDGGGHAQHAE